MLAPTQEHPAAWAGFKSGPWEETIDVRDFIQCNYTPYTGDGSFLAPATDATLKLWDQVMEGIKVENQTHAPYKIDAQVVSGITSHGPGYIDAALEKIVGLQTDEPLKRSIMPAGGLKMVQDACKIYGVPLSETVQETFTKYRKTHNQGVFDVYTPDIRRCRKSGVLTGLPDAYGRGRIIGDYRRVALYGIDRLMADKVEQFNSLQADLEAGKNLEETIRRREEINDQHKALGEMKEMAASYGFDISGPARNAVDIFCLPGGGEVAERGGHVVWPGGDLPGYLHRA